MNEPLNDQHNWTMRETRQNVLFRYTVALEHGNFDTITAIMRQAENDPVLEDMIMAVNKAHYRVLATQHQLPASPWFTIPASVGSITSVHSIPTRHQTLGHAVTPRYMRGRLRYPSVGFATALVAIILFAATFYNIAVMSSKSAAGKIAVMTTSRSENTAALYLLLSPTTSPQLLAAFSGSIAEAPGQVAWSPDGTHIAFTGCENGACNLHRLRIDGMEQRTLATQVTDFSWSPHGDQLIFANLNGQLFRVAASASLPIPLPVPDGAGQVSYPVWSPDGNRIAFLASTDNGAIYVMNADATNPHAIAEHVQDAVPVWSPDNRWLAWVVSDDSGDKIVMMDVNNGQQQVILSATAANLHLLGRILAWSPDGKMLAFYAYRADAQMELYIIEMPSLRLRRVMQSDSFGGAFAWSLDSTRLLFDGTCNQMHGIYVIGADGSNQQCVTAFPGVSGLRAAWMP